MEEEIVYYSALFKNIANEQKVLLNKGLSEQGITYVQSLVILQIDSLHHHFGAEYEVSQKDIENYLSLKGSTVTHILNRMEENELIVREKSKKDSRANHVYTTKKGKSFIPLFFSTLNAVEELMTDGMSEKEKTLLKDLLGQVSTNLKKKNE